MRYLIPFILLCLSSLAGAKLVVSYDMRYYRFIVVYHPGGGLTKEEVIHCYSPLFVANGGYYGKKTFSEPFRRIGKANVDLTVVNGLELVSYRRDLSRPILALGADKVKIFSNYFIYLKDRSVYPYAVAGDNRAQRPNDRTERSLVGTRMNRVFFVRLSRATEAQAKKEAKRLKLERFLFLDGGSSTYPFHRNPSYIIVLKKTSKAPMARD